VPQAGAGGECLGRWLGLGTGRLVWPASFVLAAACGSTGVSNPAADVGGAELTPDDVLPVDVGFAELPADSSDGGLSLEVEVQLGEVDAEVEPPQACHSNAECESGICVQVTPDSDVGVCTNTIWERQSVCG